MFKVKNVGASGILLSNTFLIYLVFFLNITYKTSVLFTFVLYNTAHVYQLFSLYCKQQQT